MTFNYTHILNILHGENGGGRHPFSPDDSVFKMKSFCLAGQLHDTRDVHDKSCKILLFVELGLFIEGGGA